MEKLPLFLSVIYSLLLGVPVLKGMGAGDITGIWDLSMCRGDRRSGNRTRVRGVM